MILPETILLDLRYGIRALSRSPWASAVTILSLALGIAVNTAVFTAYRAFVDRPLDARNPREMVNIALRGDSGSVTSEFSYPDYEAYRDSVRSFSGLIAYRSAKLPLSNAGGMIDQRTSYGRSPMARLMAPGASNAEFAQVFIVSDNYFSVLGVSALHGRTFGPGNTAEPASPPSVLVSENYWRRRFAADPAFIGKTVHLNGIAVTVIGVTPQDFKGTGRVVPAFWLPLSIESQINADPQWLQRRENRQYSLFGRLAPGTTAGEATAQIGLVADHLRTLHPAGSQSARPVTALVWPGSPFPLPLSYQRGLKFTILMIMCGAAMILAVASANVGSLQLARARSRETELRIRLSLGASRLRIVRQLLTENALIGLLAGVVAFPFSLVVLKAGVKAFADALPVEIGAMVFNVSPDIRVFAYAFVISLIAGILSGLSPAIQSPHSALTSSGRANTASVRGRRLQGALVAVQVGLSLVLMIIASMFVRGAFNSIGMRTGYDSEHVVQLGFQFPKNAAYTAERRLALINEFHMRMAALPAVTKVTSGRPPGFFSFQTAAVPVGEGKSTANIAQSILHYTYVQPGYFETLGIPLLRGRGFQRETQNGQFAVLSESAAKQIFHGENPLGRSIRLGATDERTHSRSELIANGASYHVVGVVRDTRGRDSGGSDSKQIYLPLANDRLDGRPLLIHVESDAVRMLAAVDRVITSIDPEIVVTSSTLEEALWRSPQFVFSILGAAIASGIGVLGLLLALIGIFGTVSHMVALRTREVGIRMAVGAQQQDVLRLILRESAQPVVAGLVAGTALAAGVVYLLRGMLYGINAVDGIYFVAVSILFLVVALLASYPPARRAMRVDPVVALRYE
jgi:predicted permease